MWKDVVGYEGLYKVDENGVVINEKTRDVLRNYISPSGYMRVSLCGKVVSLHRIVAQAFIPNPQNKPCVNHIDGNKSNNAVKNLEWCTHSENEYHSYRKLGKKANPIQIREAIKKHVESVQKAVGQYDLKGNKINTFTSTAEAHRSTGISQGNISMCCNNKRKTAGGYIWYFEI